MKHAGYLWAWHKRGCMYRYTHTNTPSFSALPLPSCTNEGLISGRCGQLWYLLEIYLLEHQIMNVLTLNIIQLSCLHKCIKNMYFFMQRCVEYYVLINNTNSIIQLYKKYILVIHNKLHLLFNKNNYCLSVGLFIDISSHYASISNSSMRYLEIAQQYQYNWSLSPQLYL